MGKSKSSTEADDKPSKKHKAVDLGALGALRNVTKIGLVRTLQKLNDMGVLSAESGVDHMTEGGLRNRLQASVEQSGSTPTIYGTVVQRMKIDTPTLPVWEYLHPLAYISYMCSMSAAFFNLMQSTVDRCGRHLRIVFYIDEINPGNPLHPEPGRLLQAIYWCFSDWPAWFLQRKHSWPMFGIIRTKVMKELPGGASHLMRLVLRTFFLSTGNSFRTGCIIQHGDKSLQFTAGFCGVLSDEKALKEIYDVKGQAGTFPCPTCFNVAYKRAAGKDWGADIVTLTCTDISKFKPRTKAILTTIKKRLETASKTDRLELEKRFGVNYSPNGLLWDKWLFDNILEGIRGYLRDGMHTLSSNGVAGTEVALVVRMLHNECTVSIDVLQLYAQQWVLPRIRGKVSDLTFKDTMIDTDKVRHFAGDVLLMIIILQTFIVDKLNPRNLLPAENALCFSLLYDIMTIIRHADMSQVGNLRLKTTEHAKLFLKLYGETFVRPKWHHLLHLADDFEYMNAMIACFVTERKNQDIAKAARLTFNNVEHAVVYDHLNFMTHEHLTNEAGFKQKFLCNPMPILAGNDAISWSDVATFECGTIYRSDIVYLRNGSIAEVLDFWQASSSSEIVVRVAVYSKSSGLSWNILSTPSFIQAEAIVEATCYYKTKDGKICVPPPCS
jgi:hypothetical protein